MSGLFARNERENLAEKPPYLWLEKKKIENISEYKRESKEARFQLLTKRIHSSIIQTIVIKYDL